MARKVFSELTPLGQRRLRTQGVNPVRYSAWERMSPGRRRDLARLGISRTDYVTAAGATEFTARERRERVARHLERKVGDHPGFSRRRIADRLALVDPDTLIGVLRAGAGEIRTRASEQEGYDDEHPNPFWYK